MPRQKMTLETWFKQISRRLPSWMEAWSSSAARRNSLWSSKNSQKHRRLLRWISSRHPSTRKIFPQQTTVMTKRNILKKNNRSTRKNLVRADRSAKERRLSSSHSYRKSFEKAISCGQAKESKTSPSRQVWMRPKSTNGGGIRPTKRWKAARTRRSPRPDWSQTCTKKKLKRNSRPPWQQQTTHSS